MEQGKRLTLWMITASNSHIGEMHHVYARDEAHARTLATPWLARCPHLPTHEFRAHPEGFTIVTRELPGTIEERQK